jgi:hypothetical protein
VPFPALFLIILYFFDETYNNTVFILGLKSPAGYHPELGINSGVWVNNSSCWAEGGVPCRAGTEPGAAVQQLSALTNVTSCPVYFMSVSL